MNANEIEYIQARLPVSFRAFPSPEQMDHLLAGAKRERSERLADAFFGFAEGVKSFVGVVRRIAAECTSARLHQEHRA